jgi:hypothetical protein
MSFASPCGVAVERRDSWVGPQRRETWLTCVAIAHNLTFAAATLAGRRYAKARPATIRRHLINVAGWVARHARGLTIHLPQHWPSKQRWLRLFATAHAPPA